MGETPQEPDAQTHVGGHYQAAVHRDAKYGVATRLDDDFIRSPQDSFVWHDMLHAAIPSNPLVIPRDDAASLSAASTLPWSGTPSVENIMASQPGSNSTIYSS